MALNETVSSNIVRFGSDFELDFGACELRRAGQSLKLARIPMELLLLLVEQRGQLVTREQIVERVWGKHVFLDTDNSINAVIRRIRLVLDDDPEQPRFIQTVIGRGYRFIATEEEDGSSSSVIADDDSERLEGSPENNFAGLHPTAPLRTRAKLWIGTGIGVFLVLLVLLALDAGGIRERLFRRTASADSARAFKVRPSVAVLGFKNLSGKDDEAWISTALQEMFSAELTAGQQLRVVPSEDVARMKTDLSLPAAASYSRDTLGKIRSRLNADVVVLGSYLATGDDAGGKIRIDLQLQDTRAGETIAAISRDGASSELAELVSQSGVSLRHKLGIGAVSPSDVRRVLASVPSSLEAARLYAEGLEKLRNFDALAARNLLLKAVAADPDYALSHAALSECWSRLGYDQKAQQEAKKAFDLSSSLSREDQLSVEGRHRVTVHEYPRAIEIYRMLWEFLPDNLDYGLELASVQTSAGLGKEAMATVETLSKRSLPGDSDPRIDLAEAAAADLIGDLRREESAAARAIAKGKAQGARMLTARALLIRGSVLNTLGDNANAIPLLQEALATYSVVGDKRGVARVLNNLGIVARHRSNLAEAQKFLEESLKISRETGSQLGMQQALTNLGNVYWDQGDMARTLETHRQALKISREIGDKDREATSLSNIAGLLSLQGKLVESRRMSDEALRLFREAGDQEGAGMMLANISAILALQGELPAAKKLAEDALSTDRQVGDKDMEGYALNQLASILLSQGDVAAGRSRHQEAATLRRAIGEKVTEAESQLDLAQLQLDAGDAKDAESEARRLAAVFHEGSSPDDEALSCSLLSLALSAQGKSNEAKQALAKANELAPKVMDLAIRLQLEIDGAYVAGLLHSARNVSQNSAGQTTGVSRSLETAREKARHFGYVELEFTARLRQGELELQSGKVAEGRTRLAQLRRDAQSRGFLLIAREASERLRADASKP